MPLQATSGAASYDAFGGGVPVVPNYIEDVFSTYLYTGNGSTQTITNGIDLAGKGGLVWVKKRNAAEDHVLTDTVRGAGNTLFSNLTDANEYDISRLSAFTSSGFSVGTSTRVNQSTNTYASWTFRKQPKFFDVVTYTGNGTAGRTISHSLGSVPGCILVKQTNVSGENWDVFHRSLANNKQLYLNATDAQLTTSSWNSTTPTSTVFTVGDGSSINLNGSTYVAYLFAHDAGGFGLTGTDNVISCGSYTGNGSTTGPVITLGYEPQWLMVKKSSGAGDWVMLDNMRGIVTDGIDPRVWANLSSAENTGDFLFKLNATGFQPESLSDSINASGQTYIYIAIRRGPMKVPTSGTSVFVPVAATTVLDNNSLPSANFPIDMSLLIDLGVSNKIAVDRLRGKGGGALLTDATNSELFTTYFNFDAQTNLYVTGTLNSNVIPYVFYNFRRAPSFFDEVCYTGTGSARTVTHNLTVVPELMIVKSRSLGTEAWAVYTAATGNTKYLRLNDPQAVVTNSGTPNRWNNTTPTTTVFSVGTDPETNQSGATYVAYLFATCAGVSKVGSYTGNGSSQTINCGFTGGARFVLVKATSTTGNWIVADSARGIVAGNDPALYLNSTAAEVTGLDWIDADNSGFVVNETATIAANTNGVSYIFLAIS